VDRPAASRGERRRARPAGQRGERDALAVDAQIDCDHVSADLARKSCAPFDVLRACRGGATLILIIVIKMTSEGETRTERGDGGRGGPIAALGELIRVRGLKRSRQRDVIARAFFEMEGHVPVDALAARVRHFDPRISVATVYRTMKLLSDGGLAVPRQFGDGQTRYEAVTRRNAGTHDHLICTSCGAITEFESQRIAELQLRVARRHGFEVERRHVELYGRCLACRRSPTKRESAA
jgi:Fur family ferric uptake transcriptional regulator